MKEKTYFKFVPLGEYIERFQPDVRLNIISEGLYISATVYELRSTLKSLLRYEVCYVEYFPYTLYI